MLGARRTGVAIAIAAATTLGIAAGSVTAQAPDPAPESPITPRGMAPTSQMLADIRKSAQQSYIEQRMRDKLMKSPARVAARRATRTQFADLPSDRAARLARQTFPEFVERPAGGQLARGRAADGYTGDFGAAFGGAGPDGENAFVTSPTPLRAKDASGELAPVDTELVGNRQDGWTPANPLSAYEIGARSSDGVTLPDLGISAVPAGETVVGSPLGDTIFYADTSTDTDTLLKPLPAGVDLAWQLRSSASPETLAIELDLPHGATVRGPVADGIEIVQDGEVVATLGRPVAVDANGTLVESRLDRSGEDELSVAVVHRGEDLAYPIAVDPPLEVKFDFPEHGTGHNLPGDPYYYWGPYDSSGNFEEYGGDGPYGRGLHVGSVGYDDPVEFSTAENAGLIYAAPGNASIYAVTNTQSRHILGEYAMCMMVGTAAATPNGSLIGWEGTKGVAWGEGCAPFSEYAWTINNDAPSAHNAFVFGVDAWSPNNDPTVTTAFQSYFRDATIWMTDTDAPAFGSVGVPNDWEKRGDTGAVNILAGDYSTGVEEIRITGPAAWSGTGTHTNPNCVYGPCTKQFSLSLPLTTMPDGVHTLTLRAEDPAGNVSTTWTTTVSVDRRIPLAPQAEGFLIDADGVGTDGVPYDLVATTSDQLSKPAALELLVDDQQVDRAACSGTTTTCAEALSWTPAPADEGAHTITLAATDAAGNRAVSVGGIAFDVVVDDPPPIEPDVPELGAGTPAPAGSPTESFCGPGSMYPDTPCEDFPDSDADAAVRAETDLTTDAESPLIYGDPSQFTPGTSLAMAGPLAPKGRGWMLGDQKWKHANPFDVNVPHTLVRALDDLSIKRVRLVVPFDAVWRAHHTTSYARGDSFWYEDGVPGNPRTNCSAEEEEITVHDSRRDLVMVDKWITGAIDETVEPTISFERTRDTVGDGSRSNCALPTVEQYGDAVERFLKRYRRFKKGEGTPRVFTAWNEPNQYKQPTAGSPVGGRRAGEFYTELRRRCRKLSYNCTVAAGDFIDSDNMPEFVEYFKQGAKIDASQPPAAWAVHPYGAAWNGFSLAGAQDLYDPYVEGFTGVGTSAQTPVWFTEIAGRYERNEGETVEQAEERQKYQLCVAIKLARSRASVTRFYHYQLVGGGPWDTGLLRPADWEKRLVYDTYRWFAAKEGTPNPCSYVP